jgi:hypothetical protein
MLCSEMEGRELPVSLCLDRCSRFDKHTTDFSMPILCSDMEGRELVGTPCSLCPNHCSHKITARALCFYENSTDFSMPILCSDMEGKRHTPPDISDIWIHSARN